MAEIKRKLWEKSNTKEIAHLQEMPINNKINTSEENSSNTEMTSHPCEEYAVDLDSPHAVPEACCYTVEDIEALLKISRPSVYKLINQKVFRSVVIAGKHRIPKKSFHKWLESDD